MNGNFNHEQKLADDYETPPWFFDLLQKQFKLTTDMACDSKNCKIEGSPMFDKGFDALEEDWSQFKGTKYVYPPFSKPYFSQFIQKAHQEWRKGESSIVLVPVKTISVDYFQSYKPPLIHLVYPRLKFLYNGRENHMAEAVCLLVYNAEVKETIIPNLFFLDLNRFSPSTYRKQ